MPLNVELEASTLMVNIVFPLGNTAAKGRTLHPGELAGAKINPENLTVSSGCRNTVIENQPE